MQRQVSPPREPKNTEAECCTHKMSRGNKLGATYMFLIEHVVLGNNVLNFIDSVIGLSFRKGALVAEQGDVDRSCTPKLLMENLQVIAKKKEFYHLLSGGT